MKARLWLAVVVALTVVFAVAAASSWSSPTAVDVSQSPGPGRSGVVSTSPSLKPPTGSLESPDVLTAPSSSSAPSSSPSPWRPAPVFDGRMLVAYYGTAGTGSLGVLGSGPIPTVTERLREAAARFAAASDKKVQIVYELIATVADRFPGEDGSYSHDIPRADVERYLAAARRNHALVVLDLQPGRSDFLSVAKRYAWALRRPDVGLALDPEWRMGPGQVPGKVFGSVSAAEVNATAAYVAGIARQYRLPQKVFLLHQFTPAMVSDPSQIRPRKGLAMVQHVDGWGGRADKLATFHAVARPQQFSIGFKLFYDEDVDLFSPAELLRAVPRVRFVSYQ